MDVKYLIKDLFRYDLQGWINARYKDDKEMVLDRSDIAYITTFHDNKFLVAPDIHSATSVYWRYKWFDILPTDKVIDLGANVGGFALLASRLTKERILAVEPCRFVTLVRNISLNDKIHQIVPVCAGIGSECITWRESDVIVPMIKLEELKNGLGGCDFLKMDIEGAEWTINPKELDGIRQIEGQFHYPHKGFTHPIIDYIEENFNIEYAPNIAPKHRPQLPQYVPDELHPIFHAVRK
jgi:hypothetical protein